MGTDKRLTPKPRLRIVPRPLLKTACASVVPLCAVVGCGDDNKHGDPAAGGAVGLGGFGPLAITGFGAAPPVDPAVEGTGGVVVIVLAVVGFGANTFGIGGQAGQANTFDIGGQGGRGGAPPDSTADAGLVDGGTRLDDARDCVEVAFDVDASLDAPQCE